MGKKRAMMIGLDGADPLVVKKMIQEGRLPNLKRVIEEGVANDTLSMIGAFPSVTPPNWASIATGNWPRTHGVTDFFNQTLGKELNLCELNWDSRRVESELIWEAFSREGKRSIMLNYCEAWPPRIENDPHAVYIDGSGVIPFIRCELDAPQLIHLKEGNFPTEVIPHAVKDNANDCIISTEMLEKMMDGSEISGSAVETATVDEESDDPFITMPIVEFPFPILTPKVVENQSGPGHDECDRVNAALKAPEKWSVELPEGAKVAMIPLCQSTLRRFFVITKNKNGVYDTVHVYANRKTESPLGSCKVGKWSENIYDTYVKNNVPVKVSYKLRVVSMAEDGSDAVIVMSHAMDIGNDDYFYPREIGHKLFNDIGAMMPHIRLDAYGKELSKIELETWENLFNWHIDAKKWLFNEYSDWQLFYVNLHGIDIYNHWYINKTLPGWSDESDRYQEMLYKMYEFNDKYVGAMLEYLDDNTNIIITSDHAAIPNSPSDENPGIGALSGIATKVMEDLGYTVLVPETAYTMKPQIDWEKTTAISARLTHIYLNLKGRDPHGIVAPEDYQKTVEKIIEDLYSYRHPETGKRVVAFCMTRNEMEMVGMGGPHCGDIFMQLMPTYCETHGNVPSTVEHEGYSMNNLCMMIGGDFKKGEKIRRIIRITDVVPTLCYLCDNSVPSNCEGGVIWQVLKDFTEEQFTRKVKRNNIQKNRYTRIGD